jgi:hypothetical protein
MALLTAGIANARWDSLIPADNRNPVHRSSGAERARYHAPGLLEPLAIAPGNRYRPIERATFGGRSGV